MKNIEIIKENLNTKFLGREFIFLDEVDSTQDFIKVKMKENAQDGLVVMADNQTNGKGTNGRVWYTKPRRKFDLFFFT